MSNLNENSIQNVNKSIDTVEDHQQPVNSKLLTFTDSCNWGRKDWAYTLSPKWKPQLAQTLRTGVLREVEIHSVLAKRLVFLHSGFQLDKVLDDLPGRVTQFIFKTLQQRQVPRQNPEQNALQEALYLWLADLFSEGLLLYFRVALAIYLLFVWRRPHYEEEVR